MKLRHHHGKCGSPEQLQKQLVDLSELSMRVVLSMDELHSDKSEVEAAPHASIAYVMLQSLLTFSYLGMSSSVMAFW